MGATKSQSTAGVSTTRIAWMMPTLARGYYWQPVFRRFAQRFPKTRIYAGIWPGYLPGYEGAFEVETFSGGRVVGKKRKKRFIWTSPAVLWKLMRFRPDVIMTGGFHLGTVYLILLKLIMRWRVVLLWDGVSAEIAQLDNPLRLKLRTLMAGQFNFAVSNTLDGVKYLTGVLGMPADRLLRHPYQVPDLAVLCSEQDSENSYPHAKRRPVFLYVGMLCREKGTHKLLEACAALVKRGITDFSCVLVGAGYMSGDIEQISQSLGIADQVSYAGQIPHEDIGRFYRESDVFIFPSFDDIWGMVVLEAMACGKPVLCSQYAGARELITETENGFVIDPNDVETIARYMEQFIRNPAMSAKMGDKARERISSYTPESAVAMLADVVARVVGAEHPVQIEATEDVSRPEVSEVR